MFTKSLVEIFRKFIRRFVTIRLLCTKNNYIIPDVDKCRIQITRLISNFNRNVNGEIVIPGQRTQYGIRRVAWETEGAIDSPRHDPVEGGQKYNFALY